MGFNRRNPKPKTRNRQRKLVSSDETRNPNPKPETDSESWSQSTKPETRNPKPETDSNPTFGWLSGSELICAYIYIWVWMRSCFKLKFKGLISTGYIVFKWKRFRNPGAGLGERRGKGTNSGKKGLFPAEKQTFPSPGRRLVSGSGNKGCEPEKVCVPTKNKRFRDRPGKLKFRNSVTPLYLPAKCKTTTAVGLWYYDCQGCTIPKPFSLLQRPPRSQ